MYHITLTYKNEKVSFISKPIKKRLWFAVFNLFSVIFYIFILKPPSELVFKNIIACR